MCTNPEFFLGGYDLEMVTVRNLIGEAVADRLHDRHLGWGASASAYQDEIREALARGRTPVLVELQLDLTLPGERIIEVDHHGERAGSDRPTSLHQVFALLQLPSDRWTRQFDLVAANDRGHIAGMLELSPPATRDEIVAIRAADRAAQGITQEQEREAEDAVRSARTESDGMITIVDLPHDRTTAAADLMEPLLGGPGYQNLLIITPWTFAFYGWGAVVMQLAARFPQGWYGGSLPARGFWGCQRQSTTEDVLGSVISAVRAAAERSRDEGTAAGPA